MNKYFAETIGTFSIVFCGCGAMVIDRITHGNITHLGVSLTFGLIVMVMIYALGEISGAHFNPAVTVGFALAGIFPIKQILPYIISQIIGALVGSLLLKYLFPLSIDLGATLPSGYDVQSFVLEIMLTFLLMLVIMQVAHGSKETGSMAGLAIGAMVGLEALFAGPISGASMNPARSLGPALMSGHLNHLWIYLTAPFIGAMLAVPLHKLFVSYK